MLTAQIFPFGTEYKDRQNMPNGTPIGGSGSPPLLRSLIPGTSIRFVRVRSLIGPAAQS